jgi:diguanylate cyclase (GGDEF)-like protein
MLLTLDLLSVLSGMLVLGVLLNTSSVVVAGKRFRRVREGNSQPVWVTGGEERAMQAARTRRTQRSSDLLENLLRRSYYGAALAAALGMLLLPILPLERGARLLAWLSLTGASFVVAFVLLLYWHNGDEEREARLLKTLRAAHERRGSQAGLNVRDRLTGLYTPEYWLHALELRHGGHLRRATPVTCLMIGVKGLAEIRREEGDARADELLCSMALQILTDVRPSDVVCRYRGGRFAVALLRCPADRVEAIATRLTDSLRSVLRQVGPERNGRLHVQWEAATLPGDALTPVQLLRVAGKSLDFKLSLAGHAGG